MNQFQKPDFQVIFDAMPGYFVVLQPNPPSYTILAISDEQLQLTQQEREDVVGKSVFDVYPENPEATSPAGPSNLRTSLQSAMTHKVLDHMPVVRYDLLNANGEFEERYWKANNKPVLDTEGNVSYILHTSSEITAQVKAENLATATREIEKKYSLLLQAPVALCIVTGTQNIVELANDELLSLLGKTQEIIGKPLFDSIPETVEQGFPALFDQVRQTGEPFFATELPVELIKDGKNVLSYYNFVYQPYYANPGDTVAFGVLSVAHDVTDQVLARKKTEEVKEYLDFRNAMFEAHNEASPDGVLVVDTSGKILLHNRRLLEIWKMPQEVIESENETAALEHAIQQVINPQAFRDKVTAAYSKNSEPTFDTLLFRDGRVIERNGSPVVGENGRFYGWGWFFRDVTDRIRQEQKFKNVVEQATNAIAIFKGEDLVVEMANPAVLEVWQLDVDALHQPFEKLMPELKQQGFIDKLKSVLHSGKPVNGYEVPVLLKRKNGVDETVYFNFSYQPYREADGNITGVIAIATNVNEQITIKQQLIESEARYRTLIEEAPIATALYLGEDIKIQYANRIMLRYWGKNTSLVGKTFREALPELDVQPFPDLLEKVFKTGIPYVGHKERADLLVDGQSNTSYFNYTYKPLFNEEGEVYGIHHTAIDVTEEVLAQEKIEESTRDMQNMANAMPQLVWIAMPDGKVVYYNERIFQFAGSKKLPDGSWVWENMLCEDDVEATVAAWDKAVSEQTIYEKEHRLKMKDGTIRWHLSRALPQMNEAGKVMKWFGTATDVHQRKEYEEALESKNFQLVRTNNDLDNFIYTASHDLKSPIANIEGLLALLNSEQQVKNVYGNETQHIIQMMQGSVDRFKSTIESLTDVVKLQQENKIETILINLSEVIREVRLDLDPMIKAAQVVLEVDVADCDTVRFTKKNLRSVIYNLLSNAIKYRPFDRETHIQISCHATSEYTILSVIDNGLGIEPNRMDELFTMFRRFHDHVEGTGIGLYMVKKMIENVGGHIEVESHINVGSTFKVFFPS